MQTTSGSSSRESVRSNIELVGPLTAGRLVFLIGLGVVTTLMHRSFHYPLHLPGHHGLEAMALLVLGRLVCTSPFAATIVALSAAISAAGLSGIYEASSGLLTLAPAIILDLAVLAWPKWRSHLWALPVLVAMAHATKPLIRLALAKATGIHFGSLESGVLYPLVSHLAYGFAGALIMVVLWRLTVAKRERR
jgi:hypothetical protein